MGKRADVSDNVRAVLQEKKVPQKDLANKTGLSAAMITMLLNGRRGWTLETLEKVARALGVSIGRLTEGVEAPNGNLQRLVLVLSTSEARRFRELAAAELRTPENLLSWLVARYLEQNRAR